MARVTAERMKIDELSGFESEGNMELLEKFKQRSVMICSAEEREGGRGLKTDIRN